MYSYGKSETNYSYHFFDFTDAISVNLIMQRTCYVINGFNQEDCALLGTGVTDNTTTFLETAAQPLAATILTVKLLLEYVIPAIWCFFLGSWSDKYGRKPILMHATLAYSCAYTIMLIVSFLPELSPWYIVIAYVPVCLTGGSPSIDFAMYSYMADVTGEKDRGFRLGILYGVMYIGGLLGGLSSSYIFKATGYYGIYSICLSLSFLAWLFLVLFIAESIVKCETKNKYTSLINISLISSTLKTAFKARPFSGRHLVLITILIQVTFYVSYNSEYHIVFLFVREKFQWSLTEITIYNSVNNVLWLLGNIVGSYVLHKVLRIQEVNIIMVGILCGAFGATFQALGTQSWHIYLGACSKWLGGAVVPMALSLLSKLVSAEESGKVISIVTAFQTLCNLGVTPLYTWVYNNTLSLNPGTFNFITAGICLLGVFLTIILSILLRTREKSLIEVIS